MADAIAMNKGVELPRLAIVQHRHRHQKERFKFGRSPRTPLSAPEDEYRMLPSAADIKKSSGRRDSSSSAPLFGAPSSVSLFGGGIPSMYTIFSGLRTDPFSSYPIENRGCVPDAVNYYLEEYAPSRLRICQQLNISNPYISALFPLALQHDELFSALVALSQALLSSKSLKKISNAEVLYHRSHAITQLREKLKLQDGHVDDAMIMTAICLMLLDVCLSEYRALEAHRRGLNLMIFSRGGLDKLGLNGLVKSTLLQFEYYFTAETGTASDYIPYKEARPLTYPIHPFSPTLCALISGMSPGFEQLAMTGRVSVEILRLVAHVSRWVNSMSRLQKTHHISLRDQDFALKYEPWEDLHDLSFCLRCLPPEDIFERCLCLALTLYMSKIFNKLQTPMYQRARQELTSLLSVVSVGAEEGDCLIWIWMIAIESWNFSRKLMPPGALLKQQMHERIKSISTWDGLEQKLQRFLLNDSVLAQWKLCWDEASWDGQIHAQVLRPQPEPDNHGQRDI